MVRKKRTEGPSGGESSETYESGGSGRGYQRPPERSAQGPQQPAGGQGGRGYYSQGGRGGGGYGGGGGGGGRGRGPPQQQYSGQPDFQGRGRGGSYQQGGRGGYSGGRGGAGIGGRGGGPSYSVPSRPEVPELHQATSASYQAGVTPQSTISEAGSVSQPLETTQLEQQTKQLTIHPEVSSAAPPASSKSVRFPLRPGKGSYGTKCIVKANHFFAELPNKDLHQYDVSSDFF